MITAFISAIGNAISILFGKYIVHEKNMSGLLLLKVQMLFVAVCMIIPTLVWGIVEPEFFTSKYIWAYVATIILGVAFNIIYYTVLSKKNISEIQPITILATPTAIIMAMVIFPEERNLAVLAISAVATGALLLSRLEKGKLKFDKYSWLLIIFNILYAIETILIKYLLDVTNAFSLYGSRVMILALMFFIILPHIKVNKISKKSLGHISINSAITAIEHTTKFFAISAIGIINSSMILLLGPIIILIYSRIFFKEKISLRRGIGDAIIIICIAVIVLLSR